MTELLSVEIVESKKINMETLFFLSGFPDKHNVFMDTLVPILSEKYRCVVACLPDYEKDHLVKTWGYSSEDIQARIDSTVKKYIGDDRFSFVLHDWGCVYALRWLVQNQAQVKSIACLDVLTLDTWRTACENGFFDRFWLLIYQLWLAFAFIVGRFVPLLGDFLMLILISARLGPDLDLPDRNLVCPPEGPRWFHCYPYFQEWKMFFKRVKYKNIREIDLPPTFYAYGKKKRIMFHSMKHLEELSKNSNHKIKSFDCGHWIQHKETAAISSQLTSFFEKIYEMN